MQAQLAVPIELLTTMRVSLRRLAVREKAARDWGRAARHAGRMAERMRGVNLLAIVKLIFVILRASEVGVVAGVGGQLRRS